MEDERPIRWPDDRPEAAPGYTVAKPPARASTDEDRQAAIRARVAQEQRRSHHYARAPVRKTSTVAICAIVFAVLLPVVGLILGIIGAAKLDDASPDKGQGLSILAIVLSVVFTIIYGVALAG